MKNLYLKLAKFQEEVGTITKDLENPYFKSQYFDVNKVIEIIKPLLVKNNLIVIQPLKIQDGRNAIFTHIIDAESGEEMGGSMFLPDNLKPQDLGSAITYFRRYGLVSMLLLQGEVDDDGNVASQSKPVQPTQTTKTRIIQNPANDLPFN
jgi:hypothetical protein